MSRGKGRAKPPTHASRIADLERLMAETTQSQLATTAELKDTINQLITLVMAQSAGAQTSGESSETVQMRTRPLRASDHPFPSVELPQRLRPDPQNSQRGTADTPEALDQQMRNPEYHPTPFYSERKTQLTEKIEPLNDGTSPTFEEWKISIKDRLSVNSDHYQTEKSQKALIWGATTGLARGYLKPRYQSETDPFVTVDDMVELLATYFLTGNESTVRQNNFDERKMKDTETFPEFKASFISLAIDAQVAKTEWFHYLWNKITDTLRIASYTSKRSWNNDFSQMVEHLTEIDYERKSIKKSFASKTIQSSQRPVVEVPSATNRPSYKSSTAQPSSSSFVPNQKFHYKLSPEQTHRSSAPVRTTVNAAARQTPSDERLCYSCGKPGHMKSDCPQIPSVREVDLVDANLDVVKEEREGDDEVESDTIYTGNEEA